MEHSQARLQGSGTDPADGQPEASAGEGLEDRTGYVAHQYWPSPGPLPGVVHASHPFVAHPLPSYQHHTPDHTQHHHNSGAGGRAMNPPYQPVSRQQFQPSLHPDQPPLHPLQNPSYHAADTTGLVLSPHDHKVQPPHAGSAEPYWPFASNVASQSHRHEPTVDGEPTAVASASSAPFSQAHQPDSQIWDAARSSGDVYRPNDTSTWLGESLAQSQGGPSLQFDYQAINMASPQRSSDARLSFSGGSLGEAEFGFAMPTAPDLPSSTSRARPPRDQVLRSTTSPSDVSSLSQYSSSLPTAVLYGKRPSSSESPSAVGVEDEDDPPHSEGMSRLDKRRKQNKLAQRAFRARTKTSTQMTQLMEVNEAQSQRLADMAALISTLQQENRELKLAAINAGLPPNEHVTSLGDERPPER